MNKVTLLLAVALGAVAGLGFAPLHWGILSLAAYPCLYRLAFPPPSHAHNSPVRAALLVYLFYVGNYAVSLFWIGEAPGHYSADLWWFGIIAMVIVPLLLALFMLPVGFIAALINGRNEYSRMLAFIVLLSLAEWGRGNLFTGFAWNMPAHLLLGSAPLLQNASWSGLYGGNLLMLTVLILPATLFYDGRHIYSGAVISLLLLSLGFGYGWLRMSHAPSEADLQNPYGIRIVQPNIRGGDRFADDKIADNMVTAVALSTEGRPHWVKAVIWGEAVVPFDFTENEEWRDIISKAAPENGVIIAGAIRYDNNQRRYYNSMLGITDDGTAFLGYDKHHLVPFGEYVPFADILPLPALAAEGNFYGKGAPPATIDTPLMANFIPLICYEIAFPHWRNRAFKDNPPTKKDAEFILNLTNDEWYRPDLTGIAVGYHQHLQMTRFAAVESGLPVIRAASTGISAVIDAQGRIIKQIPYGESGVTDNLLPPPQPSFALKYGTVIFIALSVILSIASLMVLLYSRTTTPNNRS